MGIIVVFEDGTPFPELHAKADGARLGIALLPLGVVAKGDAQTETLVLRLWVHEDIGRHCLKVLWFVFALLVRVDIVVRNGDTQTETLVLRLWVNEDIRRHRWRVLRFAFVLVVDIVVANGDTQTETLALRLWVNENVGRHRWKVLRFAFIMVVQVDILAHRPLAAVLL